MSSRGSRRLDAADVLARLQFVADVALTHLSLDDLLDELLTRVRDALEAQTCAVLMYDPATDELVARAAKGIEEEVEAGVRIPVGRGFAGRIAAEKRPIVIPDVDHSYVLNPILREKGIKSLLGAPLLVGETVHGVIHVGTLTPRNFDNDDIELLQVVAQRVALAIDRALVYERVVALTEVQREFIALAAHELRTPATTVYGLATTLNERMHNLDADLVDELVLNLYEQSERMRRLVEQLLDLSRLDAGRIPIEPQRMMLRTHLHEIVAGVAGPNRHDIHIRVPEELVVVLDPAAIDRVVTNLVSNALRYGEPPIVLTAEQTDHHVRIRVEDSGRGVDAEFLPFLFDRFRRSDASTASGSGTGLGLSIARSYAQAHGGDLFYREGNGGATFELVVPSDRPD